MGSMETLVRMSVPTSLFAKQDRPSKERADIEYGQSDLMSHKIDESYIMNHNL